MSVTALILAAGEGKRMKSSKPKVAHELLGKPLVRWVIDAARLAGCSDEIVVIGHGRDEVAALVDGAGIVVQEEQLGTGHAVMCARDLLEEKSGQVIVLSGDSPLVRPQTIRDLVAQQESQGALASVLTMRPADPAGYGRIVRDGNGAVRAIVEDRDCAPEQKAIAECNSGIYCFDVRALLDHLDKIGSNNDQKEYYLTDVIGILVDEDKRVCAFEVEDDTEALGVNSRAQLADATKIMQGRINAAHMAAGVTMTDPSLVWIGPDVEIEQDVELLPMTFLQGKTKVASGSVIGPNTRLTDCMIGHGCSIDETVGIKSVIDDDVTCGPRAYLRPGTHMCAGSKAGTHVEIKNSTIGRGSKVPHLSYIGDTTMGEGVNIGAGSITCNYDGTNKNPTTIGDNSFIGSDTMMVAPVNIGEGATTGAGSTITSDVPAHALALERNKQVVVENWKPHKKTSE